MSNDIGTRFSLLEIDPDPTPGPDAKDPAMRTAQCVRCSRQVPAGTINPDDGLCEDCETTLAAQEEGDAGPDDVDEAPGVGVPAAPAVDPIDAFRARMERERAERVAQGLPARLEGPGRQPITAPAPAAQTAPATPPRAAHEELVAVGAADETTGAVVYWSLTGDLDLAKMRAAWEEAGLAVDMLPEPPSAQRALRRATRTQQSRSCLVRQHPDGGWALVNEDASEGLSYSVGLRVWLGEDGETLQASDPTAGAVATIATAYEEARRTVESVDMSEWLIWFMRKLAAVSLRERGGVYFVPRDHVETLHKAKAAIKASSAHRVHEIPALKSADAVAAILDAVSREVADVAETLRGEIAEGIGPRAVRTRTEALQALTAKIEGYERLLGQPMVGAKDAITKMHADLAKVGGGAAFLEVE